MDSFCQRPNFVPQPISTLTPMLLARGGFLCPHNIKGTDKPCRYPIVPVGSPPRHFQHRKGAPLLCEEYGGKAAHEYALRSDILGYVDPEIIKCDISAMQNEIDQVMTTFGRKVSQAYVLALRSPFYIKSSHQRACRNSLSSQGDSIFISTAERHYVGYSHISRKAKSLLYSITHDFFDTVLDQVCLASSVLLRNGLTREIDRLPFIIRDWADVSISRPQSDAQLLSSAMARGVRALTIAISQIMLRWTSMLIDQECA